MLARRFLDLDFRLRVHARAKPGDDDAIHTDPAILYPLVCFAPRTLACALTSFDSAVTPSPDHGNYWPQRLALQPAESVATPAVPVPLVRHSPPGFAEAPHVRCVAAPVGGRARRCCVLFHVADVFWQLSWPAESVLPARHPRPGLAEAPHARCVAAPEGRRARRCCALFHVVDGFSQLSWLAESVLSACRQPAAAWHASMSENRRESAGAQAPSLRREQQSWRVFSVASGSRGTWHGFSSGRGA
jgi:hypothetical protein